MKHNCSCYYDGIGDFFMALHEVATAKDVTANGPNAPGERRDLSKTSVTMNEVLKARMSLERNAPEANAAQALGLNPEYRGSYRDTEKRHD